MYTCNNLTILNEAKAIRAVSVSKDKSAQKGANCIKSLLNTPNTQLTFLVCI